MSEITVLFVDDEPNVLTSLRRMLRSQRGDWEMFFVESGAEALKVMARQPVDVVVADIKMPGMDGAELLSHIRKRHPGTIRIALSGQVDLNEVIRSIGAVHQYVNKPCDATSLISRVEGAVLSREVITDERMLDLVTEVEVLPVIPRVFRDIECELGSEEPSINVIAGHIAQDVGLVAKVLKLVNSPYFGLPAQIKTVQQAITMLGLETIKALLCSAEMFSIYDEGSLEGFSLDLLWDHSFRVSNIARLIAESEGADKSVVSQARMAGLLHDVGKLLLASYFPGRYSDVLAAVRREGGPVCDVEQQVFGTTHAGVGAYLMGLWGMSSEVVHAIGFHHADLKTGPHATTYVAAANILDHHFVIVHDDYVRIKPGPELSKVFRTHKRMKRWLTYIEQHWEAEGDRFAFDRAVLAGLAGEEAR